MYPLSVYSFLVIVAVEASLEEEFEDGKHTGLTVQGVCCIHKDHCGRKWIYSIKIKRDFMSELSRMMTLVSHTSHRFWTRYFSNNLDSLWILLKFTWKPLLLFTLLWVDPLVFTSYYEKIFEGPDSCVSICSWITILRLELGIYKANGSAVWVVMLFIALSIIEYGVPDSDISPKSEIQDLLADHPHVCCSIRVRCFCAHTQNF